MSQWLTPIGCAAALLLNAVTLSTLLAQSPPAAGPSAREAYLSLPGAKLFYRDTGGNGIPVVFFHSATGSSQVWEYQVPAFTSAGFRVIAFDRRGWGRTEIEDVGPQVRTAAGDLLALINNLGIEKLHLVGTAAGGFVALDFALSFPDRVRGLVVANSIGGVEDPEFLELGKRMRPPQFDALPPDLRELGPEYRASQPQGTKRWVELEKMSRPAGPPAPAQPLRNHITFAMLENLMTPTLLITGGADLYAPPAVLRLFAARIKGAETLVIPQAGHSSYWEQPDVFNRAVLDFLRKH
jgi:pimeloyl-ACP methyl ester carboxylesterase